MTEIAAYPDISLVDIIGDLHGCYKELLSLLDNLGYEVQADGLTVSSKGGRKLVFVGDLVDRGPDSVKVLRLVMEAVKTGTAFCARGNHDDKLMRKLKGNPVEVSVELQKVTDEILADGEEFQQELLTFLDGLPYQLLFDRERLLVAHGGMPEEFQNVDSNQMRHIALHGDTTGENDAQGHPLRNDWAARYRGQRAVIYGHAVTSKALWRNNTADIDTGCYKTGLLTAVRWPERTFVTSRQADYQFTYLIIPFTYNLPCHAAQLAIDGENVKQKNGSESRVWRPTDFGGCQRLIENVGILVGDTEKSIGRRYTLVDSARKRIGLPANPSDCLFMQLSAGRGFEFRVKCVDLYLFETQVGFLALSIRLDSEKMTVDEIIDANYYLKNLAQNQHPVNYKKKIDRDTVQDVPVRCDEFINGLLQGLEVESFFEHGTGLPKQALVYSSIFLANQYTDQALLEARLFRMRRLFKDSYKPSPFEFDFTNNPEILQLFDNSFWGVSLEGMACLIHSVDDEVTNNFFSGFKGHIENEYLLFYILALHQRYALLRFSLLLSAMQRVGFEQGRHEGKTRRQTVRLMKRYEYEIANFNMRCVFSCVSNITHQARLYDAIVQSLKIQELNDEMKSELTGVSTILEMENDKRTGRRFDRLSLIIAIAAALFAVVQIIISLR